MAQKRLLNKEDVQKWTCSEDFESLVSFIVHLAESVEGRENQAYLEPISDPVQRVCKVLDDVVKVAEKHPVVKDAKTSRFGKEEFRDFYDEVEREANGYISSISDKLGLFEVEELAVYFIESWGDRMRIDYGSGHELNFLCFLYGLTKQGVLDLNSDATNIVLKIFLKYLDVMRILETKYWLEPAGSHGVWGLDDYHFLPFLFGAFQLATHKHLVPKSIHNPEVVELFEKKYCYFGCIAFINNVKTTASLRWHSPMLDDISGVKTWRKVAEGMVKMYKAEVLAKLPIMQHFYFGTFLKAPEDISPPRGTDSIQEDVPQKHHHSGWGDCCGIPIPSAIAASQLNKKSSKKTFV